MKLAAIIAFALSLGAIAAWTGAPGEQGMRGPVGATGVTGSIPSWAGASCPAPTFIVAVAPNGAPDCRDLSETTLSPAVTRAVSIPLTHFRPMNDPDAETTAKPAWVMRIINDTRVLSRTAAAQADVMSALLPLPHGAILRSVSCTFNDTLAGDGTGGYIGMTLLRTTAGGVVTSCGQKTTAGMGVQAITIDEPGLCGSAGAFAPALHASPTAAFTKYAISIGTGDSTNLMELRRCAATFDVSNLLP